MAREGTGRFLSIPHSPIDYRVSLGHMIDSDKELGNHRYLGIVETYQ